MWTFQDFLRYCADRGAPEAVLRALRNHPEIVEPLLPALHARLVAPRAPDLSEADQAALPLLRELDEALASGGHAGGLAKFAEFMADPHKKAVLRAASAG